MLLAPSSSCVCRRRVCLVGVILTEREVLGNEEWAGVGLRLRCDAQQCQCEWQQWKSLLGIQLCHDVGGLVKFVRFCEILCEFWQFASI